MFLHVYNPSLYYPDMSSSQPPPNIDENDAAAVADMASEPAGSATADGVESRRRPLRPARSVRYTREPYLENTAGGGGELGSDMTEITNVGVTGDTEAERDSR
jgi:hypothetical protein